MAGWRCAKYKGPRIAHNDVVEWNLQEFNRRANKSSPQVSPSSPKSYMSAIAFCGSVDVVLIRNSTSGRNRFFATPIAGLVNSLPPESNVGCGRAYDVSLETSGNGDIATSMLAKSIAVANATTRPITTYRDREQIAKTDARGRSLLQILKRGIVGDANTEYDE